MKILNKKARLIAVFAALGVILMLLGMLFPFSKKDGEKSDLELRYEEAILKLEGITQAEVIIQKNGDKITGAVAVCKGGTDTDRETVTKLLSSGLDLPANRIYVVCN